MSMLVSLVGHCRCWEMLNFVLCIGTAGALSQTAGAVLLFSLTSTRATSSTATLFANDQILRIVPLAWVPYLTGALDIKEEHRVGPSGLSIPVLRTQCWWASSALHWATARFRDQRCRCGTEFRSIQSILLVVGRVASTRVTWRQASSIQVRWNWSALVSNSASPRSQCARLVR